MRRRWIGGGLMMVVMGLFMLSSFFVILGGRVGGLSGTALAILAVPIVLSGLPFALGGRLLLQGLRAPKAVGTTDDAFLIHYPGRTLTLPYRDITQLDTRRQMFSSVVLEIRHRGGGPLVLHGVGQLSVEGIVGLIERRAPQVAATSRWGATLMPDGRLVSDGRLMEGLGVSLQTRRGIWITPTDYMSANREVGKKTMAILYGMITVLMGSTFSAAVLENDLVFIALIFGSMGLAGLLSLYVYLQFAPGKFGSSYLTLADQAADIESVARGARHALDAAGLRVLKSRERRFFGTRSYRWVCDRRVRLDLSKRLPARQYAFTLRTLGPDNAAVHRQLKGLLMGVVQPAPAPSVAGPGAAAPGGSGAPAGATAKPPGPWNVSVLADGTRVADKPLTLAYPSGQDGGSAWMSRDPASEKTTNLVLVPILGLVLIPLFAILLTMARVPPGIAVPAAVAVGVGTVVAALAYALPNVRGQASMAILPLPPASSSESVASETVRRAFGRAAVPVAQERRGSMWVTWKADPGLRVRFMEPAQAFPARLMVSGRGPAAQEPYLRLKGALLEEFGLVRGAPPGPPPSPLARATVVAPEPAAAGAGAPPAAAPLGPGEPLPRGPPPPALPEPPAWATTADPGGPAPSPDGALPEGGVAALPPGWWASAPVRQTSTRMEKGAYRIMAVVTAAVFAVVFLPSLSTAEWTPAAVRRMLFLVVVMGGIFLFAIVFSIREQRKQRRKRLTREAHCYLVVGGSDLDIARWALPIAQAATGAVPTLWPESPPPGASALWREQGGSLRLVLWTPEGKPAYLELSGTDEGTRVPRLKGAIAAALYGAPAAAPAAPAGPAARPAARPG